MKEVGRKRVLTSRPRLALGLAAKDCDAHESCEEVQLFPRDDSGTIFQRTFHLSLAQLMIQLEEDTLFAYFTFEFFERMHGFCQPRTLLTGLRTAAQELPFLKDGVGQLLFAEVVFDCSASVHGLLLYLNHLLHSVLGSEDA